MPVSITTSPDYQPRGLDEARRLFRSKVPLTDAQFAKLAKDQRHIAFRTSLTNQAKLIQRVRDMVAEVIEGSRSFRDLRNDLQKLLDINDLSPGVLQRLRIVYTQNALQSFAIARRRVLDSPAVRGVFVYWRYMTVGDGTEGVGGVRSEHAELHGKVFRRDDPIWQTIYPPWGWGCRCFVIPLTQAMLESQGLKVENAGSVAPVPDADIDSPGKRLDESPVDLSGLDADLRREVERLMRETDATRSNSATTPASGLSVESEPPDGYELVQLTGVPIR